MSEQDQHQAKRERDSAQKTSRIVPDKVDKTTGFLYLTGGSIGTAPPEQPDPLIASLATRTNTIAAELRGIPNEPLLFTGETKPRTEDAAIVYTWDKFLRGGDETWPLRLPMTKAWTANG